MGTVTTILFLAEECECVEVTEALSRSALEADVFLVFSLTAALAAARRHREKYGGDKYISNTP